MLAGGSLIRRTLQANDIPRMRAVAEQTDVFNAAELGFISEIGGEILAQGESSGYQTLIANDGDRIVGFTIFGPIPGTQNRYELYWIATDPRVQRKGIASALLEETVKQVTALGATHLFIETSTRPEYTPAHGLYKRHGFALVSQIEDYHADGDGKQTYGKRLKTA